MMICIVCLLFPIQQNDKTFGARNSTTGIRKVTYSIISFYAERLSNEPIFLYHNRFQKYHILVHALFSVILVNIYYASPDLERSHCTAKQNLHRRKDEY